MTRRIDQIKMLQDKAGQLSCWCGDLSTNLVHEFNFVNIRRNLRHLFISVFFDAEPSHLYCLSEDEKIREYIQKSDAKKTTLSFSPPILSS